MGRNTRQTNSTIKQLTFGANLPPTNKFRPTAFSRSVQTPLVRPGFDAFECVSKHIPLTTVSHCHDWRSWNCICYSVASLISKLGKKTPKTFVSPSTSDVTPTSTCSLFTLLVSIPCSNISQLHVLSISVQCPHVHNTLGWLDVLPIICSASSWQRRWRWQRAVLCENTADDVEHATSLKITLTVFPN